jgi:hypothetical protein
MFSVAASIAKSHTARVSAEALCRGGVRLRVAPNKVDALLPLITTPGLPFRRTAAKLVGQQLSRRGKFE